MSGFFALRISAVVCLLDRICEGYFQPFFLPTIWAPLYPFRDARVEYLALSVHNDTHEWRFAVCAACAGGSRARAYAFDFSHRHFCSLLYTEVQSGESRGVARIAPIVAGVATDEQIVAGHLEV